MAWCRQATDHYLGQYSLRSMSPYGLSRPQWVKEISSEVASSQMDIIDIKKICIEHRTTICQGVLTKWYVYIHIVSRPVNCKSLTGAAGPILSVWLNTPNCDESVPPVSSTVTDHSPHDNNSLISVILKMQKPSLLEEFITWIAQISS